MRRIAQTLALIAFATPLQAEEPARPIVPVYQLQKSPFKDLTPKSGSLLEKTDIQPVAAEVMQEATSLPELHPETHEEEKRWITEAEILILKARIPNVGYALVDSQDDLVPSGRLSTLQYDARGGLRVQALRRMGESKIYLGMSYTYFHVVADERAAAPTNGTVYPILARPGLIDNAQSVSNNSRLNYNVFDITANRPLEVDEFVDLRFVTGIRVASILHTANLRYQGQLADDGRSRIVSNFDGGGPLLGFESTLRPGYGFGVFTRVQTGLIQGTIRSSLFETNNAGTTVYANVQNRAQQLIPMAHLGLGVSWQSEKFSIRFGYEITNWFGLIQYPQLTDDFSEGKLTPRNSDLSLQGVFVQLATEF